MKVKTSITLPQDLVRQVDGLAGQYGNRSTLIERAIRDFLAAQARRQQDLRDLDILNRCADALSEEAEDVLSYQVDTGDGEICAASANRRHSTPSAIGSSSWSVGKSSLIPA